MPALAALLPLMSDTMDAALRQRIKRFFRIRLDHGSETFHEAMRVVGRMEELGLDLNRFLQSPELAQDEGEIFLIERLAPIDADPGKGRHGYNNYVKQLRNLAKMAGFDTVEFNTLHVEEAENRSFTEDELDRLLSWSSPWQEVHLRNRALIQFELTLGWRRSEVAHLHTDDIDWENRLIHCRKPAKKGRKRWVRVRAELLSPRRPFVSWLKARPLPHQEDPTTLKHGILRGPVWTSSRHRKKGLGVTVMDKNGLARAMYQIGQKAGIEECNFTRCRHTCGTLLYEHGVRLRVIQQYLGHRKVESTAVYTKPRRGFVEAQVDLVPSIYKRRDGNEPNKAIPRDTY